jgi:hypothetical protein
MRPDMAPTGICSQKPLADPVFSRQDDRSPR